MFKVSTLNVGTKRQKVKMTYTEMHIANMALSGKTSEAQSLDRHYFRRARKITNPPETVMIYSITPVTRIPGVD